MLYVYINEKEDRIVTTSSKRDEALVADSSLTEYTVTDDFDMGKDMPREDGEGTIRLDGFLTPTEFLARRNSDYVSRRVSSYPAIGDQLDALFKAGVFPADMEAQIQAVKDANPKTGDSD